MRDKYFVFTKTNNLKGYIGLSNEHPLALDIFLSIIKRYPSFEPWANIDGYIKYSQDDPQCLKWRNLPFYIRKNGQNVPDQNSTSITYTYKGSLLTANIVGNIDKDELKILYKIAIELGCNLYYEDIKNFITLDYIDSLKEKSKSKGPKLTQKQEEVLSEVDTDASWIYIPTEKNQEIISYLGAFCKESEIVAGLYKAFEKDFTGLATYQSHSIIFGKNLMTLSLPDLKNSPKPVNDDITHHVIWNLSIRFGEAQFYSYNEYEVWYIHYKNGELVYSGTNGDDGPSYVAGSVMEEIELSGTKVKELAEKNGISIEDFLIGCMKNKIKCHLIEAKNGMQVWWDGIMNQVKTELKSKRS